MWGESARVTQQIKPSRHYRGQALLPESWHCQGISKHSAGYRMGNCFPSVFNTHEKMDQSWPGLICRTKLFLPPGIMNVSSSGMGYDIIIFSILVRFSRRAAARVSQ